MDVTIRATAFRKDQYPPPDKPDIAFAGRSNVGKSSLINTLLNRKGIARTSSKPGKTQSINFFCVENQLHLVDLPGYGFAKVPVKLKRSWQHMVETYLKKRTCLRAVVVIIDMRRDISSGDRELVQWLQHYHIPIVLVLTKSDKLSSQQRKTRIESLEDQLKTSSICSPVIFSAKTKEGKKELWERIIDISGCNLRL